MALMKLPTSFPAALVWERERVLRVVPAPLPLLFNSLWNQKAVDSGKWSCALYFFIPGLHSPSPPSTTCTDWGPAPFPACVSSQTPLGVVSRGGVKGHAPSSGIWEGLAPMGFTLPFRLSP